MDFNKVVQNEGGQVTTTTRSLKVGEGLKAMSVLSLVAAFVWPEAIPFALAFGAIVDYQNNDMPRLETRTKVLALPKPEAKTDTPPSAKP